MKLNGSDNRTVWLIAGLLVGLGLSYFWPHEPVQAIGVDRADEFSMLTCETGLGGAEAVFVLDFLTGRIVGAALSAQTGKFTQIYQHNVAADFKVDPQKRPHYVMISGRADLPRGRSNPGASLIYVGELTSGLVLTYAFPYQVNNRNKVTSPLPLLPVDQFRFRQSMAAQ